MGYTIAEKIIKAHLVSGEMKVGEEIGLRIDQTLTQDATGTMAYLEFEAMGIPQVKTERSVAYIDHNTLQSGFENADDHKYIQTVAAKHGVYFSGEDSDWIRFARCDWRWARNAGDGRWWHGCSRCHGRRSLPHPYA